MPIASSQQLVFEVKVRGQIASGGGRAVPTVTSFFYRRSVTTGTPSKTALAAAFNTTVMTPLGLLLNARWSCLGLDVRCINDADDPFLTVASAVVGAVAGDSLSSTQNVYILMRTGLRKSIRFGGRHFGPLSESQVTTTNEDILNAAAVTLAGNLATAMATNLTDATPHTWVPCVLRRGSPSQLRTNPTTVSTADVTQTLVNKRIAKLKRRGIASVY